MVVTSKGLLDLLNAVQESFAIVAMQLEPEPPSSDIHRLAIVFGDTPGYQELLARLAAILAIWNAICEAFDLDPTEHPPEISRIERGSLIAEILGHPIVIATFTFVLANWKPIRAWLDKSEQTRANLETAIKLTQLVDWLDSRGVDTSNLSVQLLKAVTKQSKNIGMVAEHTQEITRNKESAAIAGVMRQLDYKNHAQRRIEHRP